MMPFIFVALIFRGLDALTTEEKITQAVTVLSPHTTVKNCKVIRDETTATSKGFCFVELNSIHVSLPML